jgi:hypothetical protein
MMEVLQIQDRSHQDETLKEIGIQREIPQSEES